MMRNVSYKPLWKLLIDRDISKAQLREIADVSASTMSKLSNGSNAAIAILSKICNALDCELRDSVDLA